MREQKKRGPWKSRIFIFIVAVGFVIAGVTAGINVHIVNFGKKQVLTAEEAAGISGVDYIVVLGAQVKPDGVLSAMLTDRVLASVEVYETGVAAGLLMSGDGREQSFDEPGSMKAFAVSKGVGEEDVMTDAAGFSTYDTMLRARDVYGAKKVIIVTQEYHLYRAIYIAEALGIEAYGVSADLRRYGSEPFNEVREALARVKAFFMVLKV